MSVNIIFFNPQSGQSYSKSFQTKLISYYQSICQDDYLWINDLNELELALTKPQLSKLIVIGGDGTIHQVINILYKNKVKLPIAIIPQGSTNILASYLLLPHNPYLALKQGLNGQIKYIDLGLINKSIVFATCVSWGYLTNLITKTSVKLKNKFGFVGYILNSLSQPLAKNINLTISLNGQDKSISTSSLIIANSLSYLKITKPKLHDLEDGLLELVSLRAKNPITLGLTVLKLLSQKNLFQSKTLITAELGSEFAINNAPLVCQIDGEHYELVVTEVTNLPQEQAIIS